MRKLKPGSRLAFDVHISNKDIGKYAREGHVIVCVANEKESDEDWVERAWAAGAEVVISPDSDIGIIIEKKGYDGMGWRRDLL